MNSMRQRFEADGFLVLEDFYSSSECEALMERGRELTASFDYHGHPSVFQTSNQTQTTDEYFLESGDQIRYFFEKDAFDTNGTLKQELFQSLNKIGHALHDLDPIFSSFSRAPQLKALATELGIENHVIIQSMLILKHARIGGVVDIHQDSSFLYTEPDSCIGFWFALEDANVENGCMWAKPGGHRTSLRERFRRKAGGGTEMLSLHTAPISTEGMIPLEVKQGSCIVLHGLLPHFSHPNTSGKSRQAYAIHTIHPHHHYPADNWLQRDMKGVTGF